MALKLHHIFMNAGLPEPTVLLEMLVDSPSQIYQPDLIKAMYPQILEHGVATAEEVGINTLADRMRSEAIQRQGTSISRGLASAWTYKA
jgi:hypothetical protein